MTIEALLGRLQRVKRARGGWQASCPAHGEDQHPSLAIKAAADGKILLKCHAGCDTEAIVAALGLTMADLFAEKSAAPPREIVATYDYTDADGTLLFQTVRYRPKDFRQRRPNGTGGGWIYDLKGVRRVLYRLPDLAGQKALVVCEGEKDVDAAWALGVPATTSPMGAGKWLPDYTAQLRAAGVERVAVIPDHDAPGRAHAQAVCASLQAAGLSVRVVELPGVPEHGDLSDYLRVGHGKEDLLALLRQAPATARVETPAPARGFQRVFTQLNWRGYKVEHVNGHRRFVLEIEKLRDDSSGTHGYLLCRVAGEWPEAKSYKDGIISEGEFNLRAVQTRTHRAKTLKERSGDSAIDWYGALEEFVSDVLAAERTGAEMRLLSDFTTASDDRDRVIELEGIPLLRDHPVILFGDGGSGKSYLALYFAGRLAERGLRVGYVDWELSGIDHKARLVGLYGAALPAIHYVRYHRPLVDVVDDVERKVREHGLQYLVMDSVGYATRGAPESAEAAMEYFRALNQLGVGSLQLAHVVKARDNVGTSGDNLALRFENLRPFGSTFWHNSARSTWYIHKASEEHDQQVTQIGLYHQKWNTTRKYPPVALTMQIAGASVTIRRSAVEDSPELAEGLPLPVRIRRILRHGPAHPKALAEQLGAKLNSVRRALSRMSDLLEVSGEKVAIPGTDQGGVEF